MKELTSFLHPCNHCIQSSRGDIIPGLTVRKLSEETHRALRMRATLHGRSTEAEVRFILEEAVKPASRLKIGSEIHRIACEIGDMDDLEVSRQRSQIQGADLA